MADRNGKDLVIQLQTEKIAELTGQLIAANRLVAQLMLGAGQLSVVMNNSVSPPIDVRLRDFMAEKFNMEELRIIADDVGMSPDDLTSRRKSAAREIVEWCVNRSKIRDLSVIVRRERPIDTEFLRL